MDQSEHGRICNLLTDCCPDQIIAPWPVTPGPGPPITSPRPPSCRRRRHHPAETVASRIRACASRRRRRTSTVATFRSGDSRSSHRTPIDSTATTTVSAARADPSISLSGGWRFIGVRSSWFMLARTCSSPCWRHRPPRWLSRVHGFRSSTRPSSLSMVRRNSAAISKRRSSGRRDSFVAGRGALMVHSPAVRASEATANRRMDFASRPVD
jgi:hypothetical protein